MQRTGNTGSIVPESYLHVREREERAAEGSRSTSEGVDTRYSDHSDNLIGQYMSERVNTF